MKYHIYVTWAKECISSARRHMELAQSSPRHGCSEYWKKQAEKELHRANRWLKMSNGVEPA